MFSVHEMNLGILTEIKKQQKRGDEDKGMRTMRHGEGAEGTNRRGQADE